MRRPRLRPGPLRVPDRGWAASRRYASRPVSVAAPPLVELPTPPAEPSRRTTPRRAIPWTAIAGVAVLTAVAAALRLEGTGTWYWVDEALPVGIARHSLTDIPHLLLRDGSPPLWYLLLHVWTLAFGTS